MSAVVANGAMTHTLIDRYLELLKKSVLEELYFDNEIRLIYPAPVRRRSRHVRSRRVAGHRTRPAGAVPGAPGRQRRRRQRGTMAAGHRVLPHHDRRRRLDNVHACLDTIRQEGVPGDVIECGVWRGGTVVFMRGYLAAHDLADRRVFVADSFAGLPKPSAADEGLDISREVVPILAIERTRVENLFRAYDLLDDRVRFLEGWFADTLPRAEFSQLALLRLDGDLYSRPAMHSSPATIASPAAAS